MIAPKIKSFLITSVFSVMILTAGFLRAEDPVALFMTWQRSPDTTMTIRWLTPQNTKGIEAQDLILYSAEGSNKWEQTIGSHAQLPQNAPYIIHSAELSNLNASTNYFIKIGTDGRGRTFKFRTMPSTLDPHSDTEKSIRFVVGGDIYHDKVENFTRTNQQAAKTSPHFALIGGDIAYAAPSKARFIPSWAKSWISTPTKQNFSRWLTWLIAWTNDMVTPEGLSIPLLPVIGNHDCNGSFGVTPDDAPFFYSFFPMPGPQGYNTIDFGNYMSIFLLDSGHTHPIAGAQTEWLAEALKERNDVTNKFALYHVPAYPSARSFQYKYSVQVRNAWTPLFDRYGLTAAFENHDHDYKRTHPLIGGKVSANGVLYFGDGSWGVGDPRKASDLASKPYLAKAVQTSQFLLVTIDATTKKVTAITPQGEVIDDYAW